MVFAGVPHEDRAQRMVQWYFLEISSRMHPLGLFCSKDQTARLRGASIATWTTLPPGRGRVPREKRSRAYVTSIVFDKNTEFKEIACIRATSVGAAGPKWPPGTHLVLLHVFLRVLLPVNEANYSPLHSLKHIRQRPCLQAGASVSLLRPWRNSYMSRSVVSSELTWTTIQVSPSSRCNSALVPSIILTNFRPRFLSLCREEALGRPMSASPAG